MSEKKKIDTSKKIEAALFGMGWASTHKCELASENDGWLLIRVLSEKGREYVPVSLDGVDLRNDRRWAFRNVDEPDVIPWTFETFPGTRCKVRRKRDGKAGLASCYPTCVKFYDDGGYVETTTYDNFLLNFERLNFQPCGEVVKGGAK